MYESGRIRTLWELVEYRAAASADAVMFYEPDGRTVTFGEARERALRAAAGFRELGIGAGTRVAWQLPTRVGTVLASLALARLGAVQIPIVHLHREREVGYVLAASDAEFVLVPGVWRDVDFTAMARKAAPDGTRVITVGGGAGLPDGDPATLPGFTADQERGGWIYYTSGTTAAPKGVRHTDASLIAGGVGLATALEMSAADIGSIAFPYAHIAGPDYVIAMLVSGFPAVVVETFAPGAAADTYARLGVTMAGGSTAFYQAFLEESRRRGHDGKLIPSLRLLSGGGAPLPPELYFEAGRELGCAVLHGYGMTECPMIAMGTPYDTDEQLSRTVGRPVAGAEVRIAGPDGRALPAGEPGEVTLKGPMVCQGYTDPALTAASFDADGWFHTGDLGFLRTDGHLVLTGRLKDIIIRKGENISAQEVEDLVREHPAVAEAAVIGLPDRERGERVCAVVTLAEPSRPALTLGELTGHLRQAGLMTQKLPEQLEIAAELPRGGPLGKVLKGALRERYADRSDQLAGG
ncbi:class I adenylate-forming enzyme family protein [Streptomyces purpurogeneiscleroticus]|uniref:class I adenylate-forming enzyme family protein n=1 Tax=Streptomyces purpurogeneiscleroticus TaxID=68259 RepID=UPI001CC0C615|nr:AMP-binding protein [Streptomyces purpurogeneiscleroticus]MBZ4018178.1 cyclohexanecarboxylate-CoA ligase [Streptomyces purpurogeneiscleroticus]